MLFPLLAPFEQLVGAAGDVKELEYVSALLQTDVEQLRLDASVQGERVLSFEMDNASSCLNNSSFLLAEDIRLYLKSRHGVSIPPDEVQDRILEGLGGGSNQNDSLDLMEIVALLLIPTLLKASYETKNAPLSKQRRMSMAESNLDGISEEGDTEALDVSTKADAVRKEEDLIGVPPKLIETVLNSILHDVGRPDYCTTCTILSTFTSE